MADKYFYAGNCVGLTRAQANELIEAQLIAKRITRETFLKHTNRNEVSIMEMNLGYGHSNSRTALIMANDFAVSYHKSKMFGRTVYWLCWSGIEYIFSSDGTLRSFVQSLTKWSN